NVAVKPGSEEYLNSEKYELRPRNFEAPGNLNEEIRLLNVARREHVALQKYTNLSFHATDNPNILFYRRACDTATRDERRAGEATGEGPTTGNRQPATSAAPRAHDILVAVHLDPKRPHHTTVEVPLAEMGIAPDEAYTVTDLLTGVRYTWRGARNYVRLDPAQQPGHLLRVER
ncbi:MAG TPA: hypothetical protein VFN39_05470, partial [Gemmatimonadaceae bacterium]|nr:hypothetical protein [Gemmatimonadaceae bacterium]